tara:strand:- start:815 stop:1045 length:231 start_codon:yes stop_codon:yes gene_type:complete
MTDKEILATADACGMMLFGLGMDKAKFEFCILAFAKQIAKLERHHEREACAKVCEEFHFGQAPMMIQRAIRARGEA